MLNYKEIWSVLAKLEESYIKLKETGDERQKKYAHHAMFALAKTDKAFREKFKEKYGKKKNELPEENKGSFWDVW